MVDACDQLLAIYRQGSPETKLEVAPYSTHILLIHHVYQGLINHDHYHPGCSGHNESQHSIEQDKHKLFGVSKRFN